MGGYSVVKDSGGDICGLWLLDSNQASNKNFISMLLIKNGAKNLVESALLGNFRIVSNSYDDEGGCFIMFGSELAPGEPLSKEKLVYNQKKKWWKFWKQNVVSSGAQPRTENSLAPYIIWREKVPNLIV